MHSSTAASDRPAAGAPARRSAVHWLALALVWITVASGSVVFTEPAPVDVLTISLVVVLPMLGLVFITRGLVLFYGAWMVAGKPVRPRDITAPSLVVIPANDRIVPPASAAGLVGPQGLANATRLDLPLGHIGMMVGSRAIERCWRPVIDWLKAHA